MSSEWTVYKGGVEGTGQSRAGTAGKALAVSKLSTALPWSCDHRHREGSGRCGVCQARPFVRDWALQDSLPKGGLSRQSVDAVFQDSLPKGGLSRQSVDAVFQDSLPRRFVKAVCGRSFSRQFAKAVCQGSLWAQFFKTVCQKAVCQGSLWTQFFKTVWSMCKAGAGMQPAIPAGIN